MWKPPATAGRFLRHVIMLITVFDFHKSLQLFHVSWSSRARRILAGCVSSTLVPFGHKYHNSCCSIFQGKCFISLSLCRFQTNGARVLAWCETKCKIYTGGPKTLVSVYPFLDFLWRAPLLELKISLALIVNLSPILGSIAPHTAALYSHSSLAVRDCREPAGQWPRSRSADGRSLKSGRHGSARC